jgi:hypothetical protein
MVKASRGGLIGGIARRRVFGKPYAVSEWNCSGPNPYRAEGTLLMASFASMHGWHPLQFDFTSTHRLNDAKFGHVLDIYNQPCVMALWPAASLIFHRRDVKEASTGYFNKITAEQVHNPLSEVKRNPEIAFIAKTGLMFEDIAYDENYINQSLLDKAKGPGYASITGELSWDTKQGLFILDTEKSQGMAGFSQGKAIELIDAQLDIKTEFAIVVLSSLTDKPIKDSDKLLLTAVARARPEGMELNKKGEIIKRGTGPILIQPVEGTILLRTDKLPVVTKLSPSGQKMGVLPVEKSMEPAGYKFRISASDQCMHYEVIK